MRVSALIPTYNRRDYIGRSIDSVLSQTLPVSELIIVDDGSTDGTAEFIVRQFGNRVRLVRQENQGVSAARRRALREAQGDWVAFLDSDDEWTPDRNRILTEAAKAVPEDVAWVFGDLQLMRDDGDQETNFGKFGLCLNESPEVFPDPMEVQHPFQFGMLQASLIRLRALESVGAFETTLAHSEDYLAGIQVACRYNYAAVDAVVGRLYRTSDLKATSLDFAGHNGPDYHRARVLAYSLIVESGRRHHPWIALYEGSVRALCKASPRAVGHSARRLALEQFRYGVSLKSLAFQCFATFNERGIRLWEEVADAVRYLTRSPDDASCSRRMSQKLERQVPLHVESQDRI